MQTYTLPIMVLTLFGAVIAFLGFFGGGNFALTALGLGAVAVAGLLGVAGARISRS
jgi:hypothetical protein